MIFRKTDLSGVLLIEPVLHKDQRGFFMETYRKELFLKNGIDVDFVQFNHSLSIKNTLRGLHYQIGKPQAKLVRVIRGAVFDVVVDIRWGSPTFGKWISFILSDENKLQLYIPIGFAHGFLALTDEVEFLYGCSDYYYPEGERGIIWNDPELAINWPEKNVNVSNKDAKLPYFKDIEKNFFYNP